MTPERILEEEIARVEAEPIVQEWPSPFKNPVTGERQIRTHRMTVEQDFPDNVYPTHWRPSKPLEKDTGAAFDNRPSEVIIREQRDAWPDRQSAKPLEKENG